MKLSTVVLCAVPAFVFFATAPVTAQDHETPTAPADYLAKENLFDVEDEDEDVLKAGKKIYKRKCKKCHGTDGDGKGSASEDIEIKPAPFNAPGFLDEKKDGQLYWIVENGSEDTEMEAYGPGTDTNLSEEDMWKVITYIRSKFSE
jgi:mono/diheme cytochrome c family protein